MIHAIRRRFIRIALMVLALAMAVVTVVINAANWVNVYAELNRTMDYLAEDATMGRRGDRSRHMMNTLAESRYYTVTVSEDGECALRDMRVSDTSAEALLDAAERALSKGRARGFISTYLYQVQSARDDERIIILLDCETRLTAVGRLALISLLACAGSVLLAWLLVSRFSSRAIKPLVENAIRQKRFITDAGHELKTPLTVISANMDVLSLETGADNEWVNSTRRQVATLRGLVGEMIELSRLDEDDARLNRAEFDLSQIAREAAEPFVGMADFTGKRLTLDVPDALRMTGDAAAIARLVSVLCDNAVKYAPEDDEIRLSLRREGRAIRLSVDNGLEKPMDPDALPRLFDRFYRADASRNRLTGGYGLGLSIARAIAEGHGGDIRAEQEGGRIRFICNLRGK